MTVATAIAPHEKCQNTAKHFIRRQQTTTRASKHEWVTATWESFFPTLTYEKCCFSCWKLVTSTQYKALHLPQACSFACSFFCDHSYYFFSISDCKSSSAAAIRKQFWPQHSLMIWLQLYEILLKYTVVCSLYGSCNNFQYISLEFYFMWYHKWVCLVNACRNHETFLLRDIANRYVVSLRWCHRTVIIWLLLRHGQYNLLYYVIIINCV